MVLDLGGFADGFETSASPLCWRDPPESSLSDWTIHVAAPELPPATYHVHRAMLATGLRRSEYFSRLFTGAGASGLAESARRGSSVELQPSAARAFPAFLDFVYKGDLPIDNTSAIALLHLANYFLNRALFDRVTEYVQGVLEGDAADQAAPLYLGEADRFGLDKAANACVAVCAKHLLGRKPGYCAELAPPVYLRVVSATACATRQHSLALSQHVSAYCNAHSESVDLVLLESLTARLTSVAADSALDLLGHAVSRHGAEALQSACARAIGEEWEDALLPSVAASLDAPGDQGAEWAPLRGRTSYPPGLQLGLLSHALVHAGRNLEQTRAQLALREKRIEELEATLSKIKLSSNYLTANCRECGQPARRENRELRIIIANM